MNDSPRTSGIAAQVDDYVRFARLQGHPSTRLGAGSSDEPEHEHWQPGWREHLCSACGQVLWRVSWENGMSVGRNDHRYHVMTACRTRCPREEVG